ncbi:hypothetical protein W911_10935 [Hyphomicrobium nitrativorans NL23]|uniref:Uncharacterized protein n=1 Tax=Hyphomicrobium nitrativorans NL23 TaxID=1029756 RepID=V5SI80_9HYPH|nr:hypothetical protein W911_10935 [Hyphomicrobium nitrativorans NL23]
MSEAQDLARDLFDEIGVRKIRAEERHIALKLRPHGLKALKLELKSAFALKQSFSSLKTVAAFEGVMGEIRS